MCADGKGRFSLSAGERGCFGFGAKWPEEDRRAGCRIEVRNFLEVPRIGKGNKNLVSKLKSGTFSGVPKFFGSA